MDIPVEVKRSYKDDSVAKTLIIYFPDLSFTVPISEVYKESMRLYESLLERDSIEFVGCISSRFEVQIRNNDNYVRTLKNHRIIAYIYTEQYPEYRIPLFHGIVDQVKKEPGKNFIKITAYDELYTKGNIDVANWYKSLTFPITLGNLRVSLLNYIGLTAETTTLPNDDIQISKQYDPETLQSLIVIQSICQINGCFGIINRDGKFEYRFLKQTVNAVYPSIAIFPSPSLYPGGSSQSPYRNAEVLGYYRLVEYQDFEVKPVDKVTIRENETDAGVTYGNGDNNYIIQGNMFAYKLPANTLSTIASRIYGKVQNISYYPYISTNNGLPYAECGVDAVTYYYLDAQQETQNMDFYIFNRELTGIQALKDEYECKGEEYQNEFITDLNANVRTIQQDYDNKFKDYDYKFDEYDYKFDDYDTEFENFNSELDDINDILSSKEVMVVVDWDETTGILETTSEVLSNA